MACLLTQLYIPSNSFNIIQTKGALAGDSCGEQTTGMCGWETPGSRNGMAVETVCKMLGTKKLQTTQIYAKSPDTGVSDLPAWKKRLQVV